jgi:peptidoglycan/xylan/chitin deacetylase (PgdA/CDA1 family)
MQLIKEKITDSFRGLAEGLGLLVNPIILNISGEDNQLLVFYFHGLFESPEQRKLNYIDPQKNMTVSQLDDFIDYFLNHNYKFIQPSDLVNGLQMNRRFAMITFDDGYYNNILSLNLLEKYGIPAVFFITTKNIIENKSFWWDIIYKYRSKEGANSIKIRNEQEFVKHYKYDKIDSYIIKNFGPDSFKPWSDIDRPMTENEVRFLSKSPFAIVGNHTNNHAILVNYDRKEIKEEFVVSNQILARLTGKVPDSVAFPNGDFNNLSLEVVKEMGFQVAFHAMPGKNRLPLKNENPILLSRFMTNTSNIKNYGGFFRVGYTPRLVLSSLKSLAFPFKKNHTT